MRVLLDTNCLVAHAIPIHQRHALTFADVERRRGASQHFLVAVHALTEAYSVLTRLPPPYRLTPADALAVIDANWGKTETVALTAAELWRVLRACGAAGVRGGRVYDKVIAECARKAKVDEVLTWNLRHFDGSRIPAVSPATR